MNLENPQSLDGFFFFEKKDTFSFLQGNFITTSHYADVVEERMLSKKCGYPLCRNPMNQVGNLGVFSHNNVLLVRYHLGLWDTEMYFVSFFEPKYLHLCTHVYVVV